MNFKALLFPEDYFQWLLRFYRVFGINPPKEFKWKIIYRVFSLPHVTLFLTSIILGFLNILLNEENFERKMLNSGVLFMHIAGGLRILRWLSTTSKMEEIIAIIQRPGFEFTIYTYNGCRNAAEVKRTSTDKFKDIRLRRTNSLCSIIFMVVCSYIFLNILTTYSYNLSKPTYGMFNKHINKTSTYRDLPYPMWFPFDVSLSDGYYLLAFFYQFYAYYSLVTSFWCVEWVVLSSIIHLQNQLTVVAFALKEVDKNIAQVDVEEKSRIRKIRLIKCLHELSEIFRAASLTEEFYNKQLLMQNVLAIFGFCTLLYVISTLTVPTEISYLSAAVGIILLQPFFQCWICQNFTIEFSKVLEQIYELDWVDYPPDLRRILVMTMMRLQKPIVFTLGKWRAMDLSFYIYTFTMFKYASKFTPQNFYTWMDFFFKILGLQPPKDKRKKILYLLLVIPHMSMSTLLVTGLEWTKLVRDFEKDFKASMLTLSLCTLHSVFIFRIIVWFFTKEKFSRIAEVVQRDSFEFGCFSIYNIKYKHVLEKAKSEEGKEKVLKYSELGELWKNAKISANSSKNVVEKFRKEKMAQTRTICCCIYLSINFISIFTIYASYINVLDTEKYEMFNSEYNATYTYRMYPYHMYFPFDMSVSHGYYWVGYFYQIYAYCSTMLSFLPVDTIVVNSIIHLISQTITVGEAFKQLGNNIDYAQNPEAVLLIHEIRIVKCITELQNIYRVGYLLEDLYNVQLLIQYGASVFILCSLCYIIPLVDNVGEFICSFIFLSATLGEIFVFTYCSQTLSLELQNVKDAVYGLNWPNYPPKIRRNLVFLIDRLQKPCVLTAGKIFILDLLFFIQVTQKSYSFYTLISNTGNAA